MTLKEYLDREPTGAAFREVVCWYRACNKKPCEAELKRKTYMEIARMGGKTKGILQSGFDYILIHANTEDN